MGNDELRHRQVLDKTWARTTSLVERKDRMLWIMLSGNSEILSILVSVLWHLFRHGSLSGWFSCTLFNPIFWAISKQVMINSKKMMIRSRKGCEYLKEYLKLNKICERTSQSKAWEESSAYFLFIELQLKQNTHWRKVTIMAKITYGFSAYLNAVT